MPACVSLAELRVPSADSDLLDQIGIGMRHVRELYALTDTRNADVGGSQPGRRTSTATLSPPTISSPTAKPTLHDRSLSMIRVALVDLTGCTRIPRSASPSTTSSRTAGRRAAGRRSATRPRPTRSSRCARAAHSLDQLVLYLNMSPTRRPSRPRSTPAHRLSRRSSITFDRRAEHARRAHAELFYDQLTDATGRAWPGWDVSQVHRRATTTRSTRTPPPSAGCFSRSSRPATRGSAIARSPCTSASRPLLGPRGSTLPARRGGHFDTVNTRRCASASFRRCCATSTS